MLRYKLRTLLILLAVGPPVIGVARMIRLDDLEQVDPVLFSVVMYGLVAATICWLRS
jgi:hypothetical protein